MQLILIISVEKMSYGINSEESSIPVKTVLLVLFL